MLKSLFKYRRFIWQHARLDLRNRYAGTGMGLAWNVIHPLGLIAIYSIVFSTIFHNSLPNRTGKFLYTIYLCSGLFPWLAFSDCVIRGCNAFVSNANYLKKLPIPEPVFVAQNAVSSTLSLVVNFLLLLGLSLLLGFHPTRRWLLLPVPLAMLQLSGFGVGLFLGTLNVFFRDVGEWTLIVLQMAMWTIPVVYVKQNVPYFLQMTLPWHPLMPEISCIHDLFIYDRPPSMQTWIAMVIWPLLIVIAASMLLHKLRPEIRDVL